MKNRFTSTGSVRHLLGLSNRRVGWDLTQIGVIDRRVRLSLSLGRGQGVGFCSWF
jgi:hypothetical protein